MQCLTTQSSHWHDMNYVSQQLEYTLYHTYTASQLRLFSIQHWIFFTKEKRVLTGRIAIASYKIRVHKIV